MVCNSSKVKNKRVRSKKEKVSFVTFLQKNVTQEFLCIHKENLESIRKKKKKNIKILLFMKF